MDKAVNLIFVFGAEYLYLLIVLVSFIWFLRQSKPARKKILIAFCLCMSLIFIISWIAGRIYYNPRPFAADNFEPLIHHKPDNGFPSHHTLLVSTVSAIVFLFNRRLSLVLWLLSLFVGISRVYVGVHHIVDIGASLLIAVVSAALISLYFDKN